MLWVDDRGGSRAGALLPGATFLNIDLFAGFSTKAFTFTVTVGPLSTPANACPCMDASTQGVLSLRGRGAWAQGALYGGG
jgi:hypothetical protein